MMELRQAASETDWEDARRLLLDYASSLAIDLSFQRFDEELAALPFEYGPPTGVFFLAVGPLYSGSEHASLGCVGLRRLTATVGEIKRLYTVPAARGGGVGRQLTERIIQAGRELGYSRLQLDTLPAMTEARRLYESLGFQPIEPYRFNPIPGTVFLALDL